MNELVHLSRRLRREQELESDSEPGRIAPELSAR